MYKIEYDNFFSIWQEDPLIVLDTNGYLGLYRFSHNSILDILSVLEKVKDRVWVPNQVHKEFYKNHKTIFSSQINKYAKVKEILVGILDSSKNDFQVQFSQFNKYDYPLIKELQALVESHIEDIRNKTIEYDEKIKVELKENKRVIREDRVKIFFEELISNGQLGNGFQLSELLEIFKEGELRYTYKIPPGYMDAVKDKDDPTKQQKFGDLLIWKEILKKSTTSSKAIIFITLDEKEDWWELDNQNVILNPRKELIAEFKESSEHKFEMMSLKQFVDHYATMENIVLENKTRLELKADTIAMEIMDLTEWDDILNTSDLLSYLYHSGDLADFLSNPLDDVEIEEYHNPTISIDSVEIDESSSVVEFFGRFAISVSVIVSESYSKHYSEKHSASILLYGTIEMSFEVDFETDTGDINDDTIEVRVGAFEVAEYEALNKDRDYFGFDDDTKCVDCGRTNAEHQKENHDPVCSKCATKYSLCPECGYLFELGSIGAFCNGCDK
jgi:hypothetical protein